VGPSPPPPLSILDDAGLASRHLRHRALAAEQMDQLVEEGGGQVQRADALQELRLQPRALRDLPDRPRRVCKAAAPPHSLGAIVDRRARPYSRPPKHTLALRKQTARAARPLACRGTALVDRRECSARPTPPPRAPPSLGCVRVGKCCAINRIISSRQTDTKPQTSPGSSPRASAAASPVACSPMTTACPAAKAAFASSTTTGTWNWRHAQAHLLVRKLTAACAHQQGGTKG
jgi:hypothetical protein